MLIWVLSIQQRFFWGNIVQDYFLELLSCGEWDCFFNDYPEFIQYGNQLHWNWGKLIEYKYIHRGGCGYEGDGLQYHIGIKICDVYWFGSESVDLSFEQLQEYQKEYEKIRDHFEMLFGVNLPKQGKLCVGVHRH